MCLVFLRSLVLLLISIQLLGCTTLQPKPTANPGAFHLNANKSNSVIFSNDSGTDDDGTWVESWVFVVTLLDNNELLVEWTRMVNNLDMPRTAKSSKFVVHGSGTIQRVAVAGLSP